MFRINKRTDYAVRVMVFLARQSIGKRVSTLTIQEEMLVPRPFLQRIGADLSKAGLVRTFPGPNGGLELARPAGSVNLRHVWEAIEGPLLVSDCLKAPQECPLDSGCPVRPRWGRLQSLIVQELEMVGLEQLAEEANVLANSSGSRLIESLAACA